MDTTAIRKEMMERIPELKQIKCNPEGDLKIHAENVMIFQSVEQKILDFFDELLDEIFIL